MHFIRCIKILAKYEIKNEAFRLNRNANVTQSVAAEMTPVPLSLSGKQDYKKTKPALRATRLKAEAKRSAPGIRVRWLSFILIISPNPN